MKKTYRVLVSFDTYIISTVFKKKSGFRIKSPVVVGQAKGKI